MINHPALCAHPEQQYLDLLRELIAAPARETRNDTATHSVFGRTMRFELADGFPLLTTKRVFWRGVVAELIWLLSGSTNVKPLQAQGISIWDEWADADGNLGPVYGAQWRNWRGFGSDDYGVTVDQIGEVLQGLRDDPHGRRHIVSAWNAAEVPQMALPPCHTLFQFYVGADQRLSLTLYQRSGDVFLGIPFNIASYALLLTMFASVLGREPGEFVHFIGDAHLYSNHITQAREQVGRSPRPFPTLDVVQRHTDMDHWRASDIELFGYDPHPAIAAEVSA